MKTPSITPTITLAAIDRLREMGVRSLVQLRILMVLRSGPKRKCTLAVQCNIEPSNLPASLASLSAADLVVSTRPAASHQSIITLTPTAHDILDTL